LLFLTNPYVLFLLFLADKESSFAEKGVQDDANGVDDGLFPLKKIPL